MRTKTRNVNKLHHDNYHMNERGHFFKIYYQSCCHRLDNFLTSSLYWHNFPIDFFTLLLIDWLKFDNNSKKNPSRLNDTLSLRLAIILSNDILIQIPNLIRMRSFTLSKVIKSPPSHSCFVLCTVLSSICAIKFSINNGLTMCNSTVYV